MSLDLVAIRRAVADRIRSTAHAAKVDVQAYVQPQPMFPIIGVFPGTGDYVSYFETMGPNGEADVILELRTVVAYGAIDSQILLDEMLSSGTGQTKSIIDALMADRTLGGVVEDCVPLKSRTVTLGAENAGMFESVVPLRIITRKEGATV